MESRYRSRRARAFTRVEAVVLLAILVLLTGVVTPIARSELASARQLRAEADLRAVSEAFTRHYADTGAWPSQADCDAGRPWKGDLTGFPCLFGNTERREGWAGPYLNTSVRDAGGAEVLAETRGSEARGLVDPWGRPYRIQIHGRNGDMGPSGGIVLYSMGSNGILDTRKDRLLSGEPQGDDVVQIVTRRL